MLAWQKHLSSKEPVSLELFVQARIPVMQSLMEEEVSKWPTLNHEVNAKLIFGGKMLDSSGSAGSLAGQ